MASSARAPSRLQRQWLLSHDCQLHGYWDSPELSSDSHDATLVRGMRRASLRRYTGYSFVEFIIMPLGRNVNQFFRLAFAKKGLCPVVFGHVDFSFVQIVVCFPAGSMIHGGAALVNLVVIWLSCGCLTVREKHAIMASKLLFFNNFGRRKDSHEQEMDLCPAGR